MSVQAARTAENKLYRLNADYVAAFLACDTDWFERHLASDFRCILADGGVIDRAAFLRDTARPVAMKSFDVEDVSVQVEGEIAIVQARTVYECADGSRGQSRYTDVWIGRDGRWQTLTAQITPLATI
jgi:ketosteroid isomerase-like protein